MCFSRTISKRADPAGRGNPWAIDQFEAAHSGSLAWSDSPGGPYGPSVNSFILTPPINLSNATHPQLTFWQRRQFATDGVDASYLWATIDEGLTYWPLATYTGTNTAWSESTIDLAAFNHVPSVRFVFQVVTDSNGFGDGWYIDDVAVINGPPSSFGKLSIERGNELASSWESD